MLQQICSWICCYDTGYLYRMPWVHNPLPIESVSQSSYSFPIQVSEADNTPPASKLSRAQCTKLGYLFLAGLVILMNYINKWNEKIILPYPFAAFLIAEILVGILIMILGPRKGKITNEGLWLAKMLSIFVCGIILGAIFPNEEMDREASEKSFLTKMVEISSTSLFLLIYGIVSIDLIYQLDEITTPIGAGKLLVAKILATAALFIGAGFLNYLTYPNPMAILNSLMLGIIPILVLLRISRGIRFFVGCSVLILTNTLSFLVSIISSQNHSNVLEINTLVMFLIIAIGMLLPGSGKLKICHTTLNQLLSLNTARTAHTDRYIGSIKWPIFHLIFGIVLFGLGCLLAMDRSYSLSTQTIEWQGWLTLIWLYLFYIWSLVSVFIQPDSDKSELGNYFREMSEVII